MDLILTLGVAVEGGGRSKGGIDCVLTWSVLEAKPAKGKIGTSKLGESPPTLFGIHRPDLVLVLLKQLFSLRP
jgi:hypothetical protein